MIERLLKDIRYTLRSLSLSPGFTAATVLSLALVVVATIAGGVAAVALGRWIGSLLFDVPPADPLTLATVAGSVVSIALVAGATPARRARRIDPAIALRHPGHGNLWSARM